MAHTKSTLGWLLALGIGLVTVAAPLASAQNQGLVVRDDTIGSGPLEVGPGIDPLGRPATYLITPGLGEQHGGNLFHSFKLFGIGSGETATFTGPDPVDGPQSVSNVISRVTGGTRSEIDGTLRSTIPGADVWLLNPSGVMFGQGAQLDVPASFHASTGDYVGFEGGLERFYSDPSRPSVLSTAKPLTFGFLSESGAALLAVDHSKLEVPAGETLELVTGDLSLTGAKLTTKGGHVGLEAQGEIVLSGASLVDVGGATPGSVSIRAGRLVMTEGSQVLAENTSSVPSPNAEPGPGSISVEASESVLVDDHSLLSVSTHAAGNAGTIRLGSKDRPIPEITLSNGRGYVDPTWTPVEIDAGARAQTTSSGAAGRIFIDAGNLTLRNGVGVSAGAVGAFVGEARTPVGRGDAGAVEIHADSVLVADRSTIEVAGWGTTGKVGTILIDLGDTGSLTLDGATSPDAPLKYDWILAKNGGTPKDGTPGSIEIRGGSVTLRNGASIDAESNDGNGHSGNITIDVDSLVVAEAAISTRTFTPGDAGTIKIDADQVTMGSGGAVYASTFGAGAGGTITIGSVPRPVETLRIESGGSINAQTFGSGHAGTIDVNADSVLLRGDGTGAVSQINAGAIGPAATGNGGTIDVTANTFAIEHGGFINAGTSQNARGNGGDIHVAAKESIDITNEGGQRFSLGRDVLPQIPPDPSHPPVTPTGIFSATVLGGDGGEITLDAPQIRIAEGAIVATSTVAGGNAGNILLGTRNPGDRILIEKGGVVDSTSFLTKGAAGSVTLQANESIEVIGRHPEFTDDLSRVTSASLGEGAPGAVTLRAPRIVVDEGAVATAAVPLESGGAGTAGGAIKLEGAREVVVRRGGQVNASSFGQGAAGSITVEATGSILVEGAGSGIVSRTGASGDGGDVELRAPRIEVASGGEVSARSAPGLDEVEAILATLRDDGLLRQPPDEATGDAGSITLEASRLVHLDAGEITTSVGIASGGDITIDPELVLLENGSRIVATADTGHGGAIQITADNYFAFPGSVVSAASGNPELSGRVEIHAPDVNLAGQATPLPASFLDASSLMRERCAARRSGERAGSFAVRGSGGIPPEPDGWLPASFDVASGPLATTGTPMPGSEPGGAPLLALGTCR